MVFGHLDTQNGSNILRRYTVHSQNICVLFRRALERIYTAICNLGLHCRHVVERTCFTALPGYQITRNVPPRPEVFSSVKSELSYLPGFAISRRPRFGPDAHTQSAPGRATRRIRRSSCSFSLVGNKSLARNGLSGRPVHQLPS